MPTVIGTLFVVSGSPEKKTRAFFAVDPVLGTLTQYLTRKDYENRRIRNSKVYNLNEVMTVGGPINKNDMNCLEMTFFDEKVLLLALPSTILINRWMTYLHSSKKLSGWLQSINLMLK